MENKPPISNNDDLGPLLQSVVFTSDPQYPWTPCTDNTNCVPYGYNGNTCQTCNDDAGCQSVENPSTKRGNSINLILEQYYSINAYADSVGTNIVTMIINGDLTAYGHNQSTSPEYQWNDMKNMLKTLKIPYYFGLGNHDQINNRNNCKNILTGDYDICFENSMGELINQDLNDVEPGHSQWEYNLKQGRDWRYYGSFAYHMGLTGKSWNQMLPHIYFIQLNSFPTLIHGNYTYDVRPIDIENWLKFQLDYPGTFDAPYITILNIHQLDDWDTSDHAVDNDTKQRFANVMRQYKDKIAAVFGGHYHYSAGDSSDSAPEIWGDIPRFLSGSAMNKSYLILEQYPDTHVLYLVCNNDWVNKKEIARFDYANVPKKIQIPAQEFPCSYDEENASEKVIWGSPVGPVATEFDVNDFVNQYTFYLNGQPVNVKHDLSSYTGQFDTITLKLLCPYDDDTLYFNGGTVILKLNSSTSIETPEDVERITQQVHAIFSSSYTKLTPATSSYQIHQLLMKINAISADLFGKEKAQLRKFIRRAIRLARERNLLVGGDFENTDKWLLGELAAVADNLDDFSGYYLSLSGATETKDSSSSYAYQKIEESKLKPNTKYRFSCFIRSCQYLELSIYRYGQEVKKILTVPSTKSGSHSDPSCDKPDLHFFRETIDVGSLYPDTNPGIEVSLRILSPAPDGFATLSNLEIVEERPLNEKEIQKIQRKEPKWKIEVEKERIKINTLLQPIITKINAFFVGANWDGEILPPFTYQDIYSIALPELAALPKLRHWIMTDARGNSSMILRRMKNALQRLFTYEQEQNLLNNGGFTNGLRHWTVEGDVKTIDLEAGNRALQLSNLDAIATQAIDIVDFDEEKEYKLVIRSKGDGTISIQHGDDAVETIEVRSQYDFDFYHSEPMSFEAASLVVELQSDDSEFIVDYVEIIELWPEES
ncbi:Calcineurin-like phosphoesterase [Thermoactinomyces sp. DSM 45891]|uniref:metallophosphoesterase n=1 Tax=Thermoactinomyces sp. DSM 45891 TaxID=1761907 RepID=UPI00091468E1|nr:metallophosphoesterase [Thermoactinomyces sp. DSM 45891]SFX41360.1 Calcineurin-like phosphoesterase [Thermoactinomyces sp. DSM 45891]